MSGLRKKDIKIDQKFNDGIAELGSFPELAEKRTTEWGNRKRGVSNISHPQDEIEALNRAFWPRADDWEFYE